MMKVSVIVPVLNNVKHVEACILSFLGQSYIDAELLLIDGASTDGTLEILEEYHAKYPDRVRYISEKDRSAGDAINKGLKIARGSVVGFLGADDTYEPNTLVIVIETFAKHPDAGVVFGNCNTIDEEGQFLSVSYARDFNLEEAIHSHCYMYTPAVFFKKGVTDKLEPWDWTINACDFDFFLRAGILGIKFQRVDVVLTNFRLREGSISCAKGAVYMYAWQNFKVAHRYGAKIYEPRGRNLIVTYLTHPLRFILAPIYHNRVLYPILGKIFHKIIGGKPPKQ